MSKVQLLLLFFLQLLSPAATAEKAVFSFELPVVKGGIYSYAFSDTSGLNDIPTRFSVELFTSRTTSHGGTPGECSVGLLPRDIRITNVTYGSRIITLLMECDSFAGLKYYRLRAKRCEKRKEDCELPKSSATRVGVIDDLAVNRRQMRVEDPAFSPVYNKAEASGNSGSYTSLGRIPNKTLSFNKILPATKSSVKITYYDNFKVDGGQACIWEILFNGHSCPTGRILYSLEDKTHSFSPGTLVGICNGLRGGTLEIQVEVRGVNNDEICHTGWDKQPWLLYAEELAISPSG